MPFVVYPVMLTFVVMLLFEALKEYFFHGSLKPWQSHWMTIVFTTSVSLIVALLTTNKMLALREQSLAIELKDAKIKSIKQVMYVVHHHVNNLANSLGLIHLDMEDGQTVSTETLESLQRSVDVTAEAMRHLGEIEDPYDESTFEI